MRMRDKNGVFRACNSRIVYMLYDNELFMLKSNKIYDVLYAGCPSFRGINVSAFQSINLVMTYNYFFNKNIWTYISSLYLITITHR